MPDPVSWRRVPARQVISELRRLNSELRRLNAGRWPRTYEDCQTIAFRMNWRLRILPYLSCPEPFADERKHVIFLPYTTDRVELARQAFHELSEILTDREGGEPEYRYQGGEEEHHHVATLTADRLKAAWAVERARLVDEEIAFELLIEQLCAERQQQGEAFAALAKALQSGEDVSGLTIPSRKTLRETQTALDAATSRLKAIQDRLRG